MTIIHLKKRRAGHTVRRSQKRTPASQILLVLFIISLAFGSLWGCADKTALPVLPKNMGSAMVQDVPFLVQEQYQCGPAALAMVLNHAGDRITPDAIARDIFRKDIRGSVNLDMILYPRRRGFDSLFGKGSPQTIINAVDIGRPIVVMVDQGLPMVRKLHYMVVVGYTPTEVVVHSGTTRCKRIPWKDFLSQWEGTGYWMLTVKPKER